jgi:hypothetical protein
LLVVTDASSTALDTKTYRYWNPLVFALTMACIGDYQNASSIIYAFKHTNAPGLKNLFKYHKHQTQLLSTIFSNIEKKQFVALVESKVKDEFLTDISKANVSFWLSVRNTFLTLRQRLIHGLERALRGGSLAVWFQFEESQQELEEIQLTLGIWHTFLRADNLKHLCSSSRNFYL